MARARNIKPGFYENEDLAECSVWARYIFPGLWMLADREGRLEDRPKRIKAVLLPFDNQDVDKLLHELHARGFLARYQNEAGAFIQISKFRKHQSPHYSEKPSTIKPPILPESARDDQAEIPGVVDALSPDDSRSRGVIKRGSQPPDVLIPDSLIPDSTPLAPSAFSLEAGDAAPGLQNGNGTPAITIPLVDGNEYPVTTALVCELDGLYPAVDAMQTLREIRAWNLANPRRRKTSRGILQHINGWFSKEQNRG